MTRVRRQYGYDGLAGCVSRHRSRQTGTLIGIYNAEQAGLDSEGDANWYTLCEDHGESIAHRTLHLAKDFSAVPAEWCEACGDMVE